MNNLMEVMGRYGEIIDLQKQVIDELFSLLCQHLTVQEMDNLPCVEKINKAAAIRAEIDF